MMLELRPSPQAVKKAKELVTDIDQRMALERTAEDIPEAKRKVLLETSEREKLLHTAVIQLETLHQFHEELLSLRTSRSELTKRIEKELRDMRAKGTKHFYFCGRDLKSLPRSLASVSFLAWLDLSYNEMEELPSALGDLGKLEVLYVQANHLKTLPHSIGNLSNLIILNVASNHLKTLPESLGNCSNLEELSAGFNHLEVFNSSFGWKLKRLRKLDLHLNKLVRLPDSAGELRELRYLNLRSNRLRSVPSSLGQLFHLETLDLSRNFRNLCTLPKSLGCLVSLSVLDLSYNQISKLPTSFGMLQNLETLRLNENPLVVPPKRVTEHSLAATLGYLLDRFNKGTPGAKTPSPPKRVQPKATPIHEHAGGWISVRPGNSWMRSFLGHFVCGGSRANDMNPGKTMPWQPYHSDDEAR